LSEVVPALQSGNIDGMLAGMPILTAFKFYDVAQHVTDLQFSIILSVNVINETWFQSQSEEVRQAIIEAGRVAEEAVLQWGIDNVGRANQLWIDNGGEILALSDEDRAAMNQTFKAVSDRILSEDPEVAAEYEKLLGVVEAQR
jgi:TRAP-type C4-dicarboxylate transport system substrate-binding protein